ncbi:cilia- and flagella-associated protein 74 isoform X1 [Xiphophorus couchianus]|uniref:cilia- and flagella-associated protein 74 isoform X1 n=2 Tax=Xiphophorus couchianus TaxID=32473 RepID=UPI001016C063|nr:cilia- and flagella-associated protein 74 isoform X1 [Xiphophorus couchianus]XP_027869687.1 cilia- and flagella-associated protein 74 isoform X1 [Xiphophorus couchianus]XP_027870492.1 cilia- and flagella-associated protein 74 isoform X1 [Xiphophorus couchianus]
MDFEEFECAPEGGSLKSGLFDVILRSFDETEEEEEAEEEVVEVEDVYFHEEPAPPPDLDWVEELSDENEGEDEGEGHGDGAGDFAPVANNSKQRTFAEIARMFKLKRNLDQIDSFYRQKEHDVQKTREKLNICCHNIKCCLEQKDQLEWEIEQQKANDNSVAVFRLRTQHELLCQNLQNEEKLEGQIHTKLRQQEMELNMIEVQLGNISKVHQEMEEDEQLFEVLKAQKAVTRLEQERKVSQNRQRRIKLFMDEQAAKLRKEEIECQRKTEEFRANRKIAAKYLRQSNKRLHQQVAEKEQQNREFIERRIQAVESLKSNIAANQESLRGQQKRAKKKVLKKEQDERQLKASLEAQGFNGFKHVYLKRQLEEAKQKQQEFEESQKSKRLEIVAKMLQEEQLVKKRSKAPPPNLSSHDKFSSLRQGKEVLLSQLEPKPPSAPPSTILHKREYSTIYESSSTSSDGENFEMEMEEIVHKRTDYTTPADFLVEPEFSGLWEQECKKPVLSSAKSEVKEAESSMDSGMLNATGRRILKQPPFSSKPEVVLFKDFDVGKRYKKKIVLTNISYTISVCKFIRISAELMEFISVKFQPPGSLSTGMSCEMLVIFHPLINEDLEGECYFESTFGPFSVPVRCTIKKCNPEVDCKSIDFGSHVVGQSVSRTITLTNNGALASFFSMGTSMHLSPARKHAQMPSQDSANTDPGSENITYSRSQSSYSLGLEEVHPKQQSLPTESEIKPHLSSDVGTRVNLTLVDYCDIILGNVRGGEIGPFQSVKLEILFKPTIPGETIMDFYIRFSDTNTKPIPIHVSGVAVSNPVWVIHPSIDLKICTFDCLYQYTIVLQSRENRAFKLTFDLCPEMRKHLEIIPKRGFIQALSTFKAQLKFIPRQSLSKDAQNYFDSNTGVLEVPMTVQVAGQVRPAQYTIHAIVTSSDLQFDHTEVDFGHCSICHFVRTTVCLTNMSILPQDFGFVAVPEYIEVQPYDGFGTLLPQETLEIDLIFSPKKPIKYDFQLRCKSGIDRDFVLPCRGVGFHPPLVLSHSLIQFRPTAVGDKSTATIYLTNYQDKEAATRLIKVVSAVEAPRLFCFNLPKDSDISITPAVGRLLPGERCLVQVMFRPVLLEKMIAEEALRLQHSTKLTGEKEPDVSRLTEQEMKRDTAAESNRGRRTPGYAKRRETSFPSSKLADRVALNPGCELYGKARDSLLRSFTRYYKEYIVRCFVSDGDPPEANVQPTWSPINTLHLKLECPAIQPPLLVISGNGNNVLDFRQVYIGSRVVERFTIQNISEEPVELTSSLLDLHGPFSLVNAMRGLNPGEKHTLVLAFSPTLDKKYCEILHVRTPKMVLEIILRGEGALPFVSSSHSGNLPDVVYALEKDIVSQHFKLTNRSAETVDYRVMLASHSLNSPQHGADRVTLLLDGHRDTQIHPAVGTQNYRGLSVFSVLPLEGSLAPGKKQDIAITFQPDHSSLYYTDRLTIELLNKCKVCEIDLKGAVPSRNMYLCGVDPLTVPIDSLLPVFTPLHPHLTEAEEKPYIPLLVTLVASCKAGVIRPAVRELRVGCISSPHSNKKSGEFHWDDLAAVQQQGFQVEPAKGVVEAGSSCSVTITWMPQSIYKPLEVVQVCVPLTVKSDETTSYKVTLMAFVSSAAH